jgi:excisionase family DNA binding protein
MLLNVTQAARELGVSAETIQRNIRAKRWPFYQLGPKTTRVDPNEIRALGKLIAERKPELKK